VAAPTDNSTNASLDSLSSLTNGGVIVDIGTGDGRFVYQCARENRAKFYIGIDANTKPLEKISMKATRKPAKGGAPNALFIQAAIEELPTDLNDTANEIHIHFPWGSLLRAVATGDENALRGLHRIGARGCLLEVVIGIDTERDRAEIERLALPDLSLNYIESVLTARYEQIGFEMREKGVLSIADWERLHSSWARRLAKNDRRQVVYFIAEARK
jgi:16S rRNA (adenine(1408)-N(1))-methyltransferase